MVTLNVTVLLNITKIVIIIMLNVTLPLNITEAEGSKVSIDAAGKLLNSPPPSLSPRYGGKKSREGKKAGRERAGRKCA